MTDNEHTTHEERVEEHLTAAAEEVQAAEDHASEVADEIVEEVSSTAEAAVEASEEAQEAAQEAAEEIHEEVQEAAEEHGLDYDRLADAVAAKLVERGHVNPDAPVEAAEEAAAPIVETTQVVTDPIRPTSEHWFFRPWKRGLFRP